MTNAEIQALIDAATADINAAAVDLTNAVKSLQDARAALDPVTPPPPPAPVIPRFGGAPGFGIISRAKTSAASIAVELDKWKDIGCQILRIDCLDNTTYQSVFGQILAGCEQRGIKMIACVRGTSGPYSTGATAAADIGKRMATSWGTRVLVYEYVNEPNLPHTAPRYPAAKYGAELAAFYSAVKAAGPYLVANGGMGSDGAGSFSNWWPTALTSGARDHFDLGNVHAYEAVTGSQWTEAFKCDFQGKPIIVTEAGARFANQVVQIPAQLTDKRAACVCYYTMLADGLGWNLDGNPGYASYKAVPK